MRSAISIVNGILIKPLRMLTVACCAYASLAPASAMTFEEIVQHLPDLSESGEAAPGRFDLDEQSVTLGYDSRLEKWSATLDEYANINPSLTVDYGRLLTNRFGAGATLTHQSNYSEVLVNGVYAPKNNVRLRVSGGQLRAFGNGYAMPGHGADTVFQNSYLVDVKKHWTKYKLLSDVGLAAYTVEANVPDYTNLSALTDTDMRDTSDMASNGLAAGRMNGYLFKLGLQPTDRSRIELRRETGYLVYSSNDGYRSYENLVSHRIKYSQYLRDCTRVQGSYTTNVDSDRLDLGIAKNNWNINLSRALDSGARDTEIQIGYVLPLGRLSHRDRDCGSNLENINLFEPIVDTTIKRPQQFPSELLVKPEG